MMRKQSKKKELTATGVPSMPWHIMGLTGREDRPTPEIACGKQWAAVNREMRESEWHSNYNKIHF
jgi:hypothetical protein